MGADKVPQNVGAVEGAAAYGRPADVEYGAVSPHGVGIPYVSDTPFVEPYLKRAQCGGTRRKDGLRCGAKAEPGEEFCRAHAA